MSVEERNVRILAWPDEAATLEHHFKMEEPCPVRIIFEKEPAHVVVHQPPEEQWDVNMDMNVAVKDVVPVCIKLCEPICARSDYTVKISIFQNPFATIQLNGQTVLFNCHEGKDVVATVRELKTSSR